jgi:hypothetical protein
LLRGNRRMGFRLDNLGRKGKRERQAIGKKATHLRTKCTAQTWL